MVIETITQDLEVDRLGEAVRISILELAVLMEWLPVSKIVQDKFNCLIMFKWLASVAACCSRKLLLCTFQNILLTQLTKKNYFSPNKSLIIFNCVSCLGLVRELAQHINCPHDPIKCVMTVVRYAF